MSVTVSNSPILDYLHLTIMRNLLFGIVSWFCSFVLHHLYPVQEVNAQPPTCKSFLSLLKTKTTHSLKDLFLLQSATEAICNPSVEVYLFLQVDTELFTRKCQSLSFQI